MNLDIALFLGIVAVALVLFWRDKVPADVVALGALLAVILTGLLPADEAFRGFGSDTVMMILGLLLLASALVRTGVVDILGSALLQRFGDRPQALPVAILIAALVASAFINNTAAAALFLPVGLGLARRAGVSPSRLLLPMAFGSILASSILLVSTSTNVVVSGLLTGRGLEPLGLFELTPVGVVIAFIGTVYMATIGRRLVPDRAPSDQEEVYGLRHYLTEVLVLPGSPLAGKSLEESGLGRDLDLTVLRIVRRSGQQPPSPSVILAEGDVLVVEGSRDQILRVKDRAGIDIKADAKFASLAPPGQVEGENELAEAVLLVRSPLLGTTLKQSRFRERYGLQVLAIHRQGEAIHRKLSELRLAVGDLLLLQGSRERLRWGQEEGAFRLLQGVDPERPNRAGARWAIAAFAIALLLAASEVVSMPVAFLTGALVAFVLRCVSPADAYRDVDWRVLVLIGCMLGVGRAMETSGAAVYLAGELVSVTHSLGPHWVLAGFFLLTVVLTQPMSNQAAAVVVFPLAVETAVRLNFDPRPFAVMIAVAASCSFLTPLEPACLMVYGPGRYRFSDFLRVGLPLTVLIFVIALVMVPRIWPFTP